MAEELQGNLLVVQSGPAAAVTNAVLAGVVTQALNHACIEEIYGALGGVDGLVHEEFTDLASESQQTIRALRHTPGAALGTSLYQLRMTPEFERVVAVCKAHNIRFFVMIGGADEMSTAVSIDQAAKAAGWEMRVIGMPVSAGNAIGMTDHAPGYGSAIKYIATTVREISMDALGEGAHDFVAVIEVMGRQNGWLAAGSALARRRDHPEDAPHLVYLPEVPFDPNRFLDDVSRTLKNNNACIVVVSQGLFDENGNYISFGSEAEIVGNSPRGGSADYLRDLVSQHISGVRSVACRLNLGQRCACHYASATDVKESFRAGQDAVEAVADQAFAARWSCSSAATTTPIPARPRSATSPKPSPRPRASPPRGSTRTAPPSAASTTRTPSPSFRARPRSRRRTAFPPSPVWSSSPWTRSSDRQSELFSIPSNIPYTARKAVKTGHSRAAVTGHDAPFPVFGTGEQGQSATGDRSR
jgi:6-phosphofructokinase 1